jgi:hypothetical protein
MTAVPTLTPGLSAREPARLRAAIASVVAVISGLTANVVPIDARWQGYITSAAVAVALGAPTLAEYIRRGVFSPASAVQLVKDEAAAEDFAPIMNVSSGVGTQSFTVGANTSLLAPVAPAAPEAPAAAPIPVPDVPAAEPAAPPVLDSTVPAADPAAPPAA